MDIIKQIINCETNTKFVKVIEGRYIEIPDVIFMFFTKVDVQI